MQGRLEGVIQEKGCWDKLLSRQCPFASAQMHLILQTEVFKNTFLDELTEFCSFTERNLKMATMPKSPQHKPSLFFLSGSRFALLFGFLGEVVLL